MCISSRYFATVRLEISKPDASRSFVSLASEYGFFLSSDRTSSSKTAFTRTHETSSPNAFVKKDLISTMPCGVITYLPEVARDTVDSDSASSSERSLSRIGSRKLMPSRSAFSCLCTMASKTHRIVEARCSRLRMAKIACARFFLRN